MAFVKVAPDARAGQDGREDRFAAWPRCSTPSGGVGVDARIVADGRDLDEVRALFREYAEWLAVDLSFQDFASELAGLPGGYTAPKGTLLLCVIDEAAAGCIGVREWQADQTIEKSETAVAALAQFRMAAGAAFSDCLVLEAARKTGHLPLGTLERDLGRLPGAERFDSRAGRTRG